MIDGISYGKALYELAQETGKAEVIGRQLDLICEAVAAQPSYVNLMDTPAVGSGEKCRLIREAFGDAQELLQNFLCILCEKRGFYTLPTCRKAFHNAYDEEHAIVRATALTAVPMEERQKEALIRKLSSLTGKTVELENRVDPDVIGGIRLRYGGVQLDDTIASRLESLRKSLAGTIL